jgi:hypothetical protein
MAWLLDHIDGVHIQEGRKLIKVIAFQERKKLKLH